MELNGADIFLALRLRVSAGWRYPGGTPEVVLDDLFVTMGVGTELDSVSRCATRDTTEVRVDTTSVCLGVSGDDDELFLLAR